jgi:hypothetical protein
MKFVLFMVLASFISANVLAAPKILRACTAKELVDLEASIKDWVAEDYPYAYYMKNSKNEVLGFYATDKHSDMYAEVCEYAQSELTTSSSWYYWDESSVKADPATWTANGKYRLTQDEGVAYIKMIKASKTGNIQAEFQVKGFEEDSEEILLMKEIVTFEPKK